MGVGEAMCADGKLYMTAVLRQGRRCPRTGCTRPPQYFDNTGQSSTSASSTRPRSTTAASTIPLLLDVYTPPSSAPSPRPDGHRWSTAARSSAAAAPTRPAAPIQWANRGYNAVSIDYRLDQRLYQDSSPPKVVAAATNATIDAEQRGALDQGERRDVRRRHRPHRRDRRLGRRRDHARHVGRRPTVEANPPNPRVLVEDRRPSVSTGAYLTPALDLGVLHLTAGLAPILMFHYETDVASNTGAYAFRTCQAYRDAGSTCDYISQPGEGHTTDLTAGHVFWATKVGPFLWQNLHLAGLPLTGGG